MEQKILLALHLRYLDKKSLARAGLGWPGLASEVEGICRELGIENANTTKSNKYDFKLHLSQASHRRNEVILRNMAERKEKGFWRT